MSRVEPYTRQQLQTYLEGLGFERVDYGSGHLYYLTPAGEKVPCPGHGRVTIPVGAQVATLLGVTRQELIARVMGSGAPSKTGKIRRGLSGGPKRPPAGRGDVVRTLDEVTALARDVRVTLTGVRDSAHYERLMAHTLAAKTELTRAVEACQPGRVSGW